MTTALTITVNRNAFMPDNARRDVVSRINNYLAYLEARGKTWIYPDLPGWRDWLIAGGASPTTASSYLSTIRAQYRRILKNNDFHDFVLDSFREANPDGSPADIKAMKDEMILRFHNAVDAENSKVNVTEVQDVDERQHIRLTPEQVDDLLELPLQCGNEWVALRDRAMIALAVCTGVRADELTKAQVKDLTARYGGVLSLKVIGKGNKQRLIPYGDLIWGYEFVMDWLEKIGRKEGYVFSKIDKGKTVLTDRLNPQAFNDDVLANYPLPHIGTVNAHDLRRTYAKIQFDRGMELVALQQNLGHARMETTLSYIGARDAEDRKGKSW